MTIRETVAKGAALLDQEYPEWRYEISVESLSMASSCWCVLGQLYGTFWKGLEHLEAKPCRYEAAWDRALEHGFCVKAGTDEEEIDALQAEWIEQIKKGRVE